jgi:hypothetical protein
MEVKLVLRVVVAAAVALSLVLTPVLTLSWLWLCESQWSRSATGRLLQMQLQRVQKAQQEAPVQVEQQLQMLRQQQQVAGMMG